ncbi:HAD family hydrolase [Streptomyces sp. NPDC020883]|uniref:HAD family hydrolase n=1 Tax=unclassified Streptomyces TaxID=2593676 RepID=UPI0028C4AD40|nr:HAD hydrolase-like protein [Streptomyces sp. BHT-5-2]
MLIRGTPADVEGGRANGVRVIAVASGRSAAPELRDAGADAVVPDLRDTKRLPKLIRGSERPV